MIRTIPLWIQAFQTMQVMAVVWIAIQIRARIPAIVDISYGTTFLVYTFHSHQSADQLPMKTHNTII
jgi:hypothetical protein